jgi:hypothetical protein
LNLPDIGNKNATPFPGVIQGRVSEYIFCVFHQTHTNPLPDNFMLPETPFCLSLELKRGIFIVEPPGSFYSDYFCYKS